MQRLRFIACSAWVICLLAAGGAWAQLPPEEEGLDFNLSERPKLRIGALGPDLKLDGRLDDATWRAVTDSIADLITIEPVEGATPNGRTIVKVVASTTNIVIGVQCFDPEPDKIVSFSKARDSELAGEDHIVLVLDTFMDGQSGYVFSVNPAGARVDGLVFQRGEEVNNNWDTIWEAETVRDATGWSAEIWIPVSSIGFQRNLKNWGFNVQRRVQGLQETSRWSGAHIDYEIFQSSQSGLLEGLPAFDQRVGLTIRPAAVGRVGQASCGAPTDYDGDFVLDASKRLGPNMLSSLTVNTDFAETEVDVRQINLTRFPLYFPEKRTFFTEGADLFEFGVGLDEESALPFYTRRIGLFGFDEEDQAEVPINVGGKITGRVGSTGVGALVVNTRDADKLAVTDERSVDVPQATMGAVRIKQDILAESSIGVIGTFGGLTDKIGDPQVALSNDGGWEAGADLTYQTSSFMGDKNFLIGTWGLVNDRADLHGEKSAWGARIDYPNDLLDMNLTTIRIGDGFDPTLGFVPRNNTQIWEAALEFNPRTYFPFVHQMFHELSYKVFNERSNDRWQSYSATIKPLHWLLRSGDEFDAGVELEGDRPTEHFEIAPDVDIAPGSYEYTRYFAGAAFATKRRISGSLRTDFGNYYNGDLTTIEVALALKPSALFTLELSGERSTGEVLAPEDESVQQFEKNFKEQAFGVRWQLNFTPDLQISSLTQYDTQSRELGTNNRLRWTFAPAGDLFVVYNHNWERTKSGRYLFISNQLPVKLQYAFRF